MIGSDAWLQGSEHEDLAVRSDPPDGPATIANVQIAGFIEGDACGNAHALSVSAQRAIRRHTVDGAVITRGNIKLSLGVKRHARGVHQLREKWLDVVIGINLINGDGDFLSTATRIGDVNVAVAINGRVRDRMEALRDALGNL